MIKIVVKIIEQNNQMTVKIQSDMAMNDPAKPLKTMGSRFISDYTDLFDENIERQRRIV